MVSKNNLELNTTKTKELIIKFRRKRLMEPPPILINGTCMEKITFKFLGVLMSDDLTWICNTTAIIKKKLSIGFISWLLKRDNLEEKLLVTFYRSAIESILTYSITAWYANCTEMDKKALQRVVHSAERIIGCLLPIISSWQIN